ncbi:MAG: hypothetical protein B1H02_05595 [Candidatus Latescibacteria bacterium 4484_107]|nr:MAG: hypothetical protein B1H02_05595 [Candidatus Latescibacteria bacterium 4484_107]
MKDIRDIIEGWEFVPNRVNVRKIIGDDGRPKIQMRLDLGLIQMEETGRPDGKRPHGRESLLDYYLDLLQEHKAKYKWDAEFRLDREDCAALNGESIQFYQRRICFFQLGEYEAMARDAAHNLRVMDLIRDYAEEEEDRAASERFRPFVLMHWTQARTLQKLKRKEYDEALARIEEGVEEIRAFLEQHHRSEMAEDPGEIQFLKSWSEEIQRRKPLSRRERLEKQLDAAVAREHYEQAVLLRDRLKHLQ